MTGEAEPFDIKSARIFIVDDEPVNGRLLERGLKNARYSALTCITGSRQVVALCQSRRPDLILLDLMMPHINGFEVMAQHSAASSLGGR